MKTNSADLKQLEYNITQGILSPEHISKESFRYSWRGMFGPAS